MAKTWGICSYKFYQIYIYIPFHLTLTAMHQLLCNLVSMCFIHSFSDILCRKGLTWCKVNISLLVWMTNIFVLLHQIALIERLSKLWLSYRWSCEMSTNCILRCMYQVLPHNTYHIVLMESLLQLRNSFQVFLWR